MIKDLPGVAALQRRFIMRFLAGQRFAHTITAGPARGLHVEIVLPQDKGLWTGTYEAGFTAALAAAVRPGDVCFDVGAYRGFMSGVFALRGAREVITFEPLPENVKAIERLIGMNSNLPIRVLEAAIGNRDGEVSFERMPEASMAKVRGSDFQSEHRGGATFQVQMRTLDSLVEKNEIPPPNVVKIDVEGSEVSVIEGARAVLMNCKPKLLIEAHSPALAAECIRSLSQAGYQTRVIDTSERYGDPNIRHLAAEVV